MFYPLNEAAKKLYEDFNFFEKFAVDGFLSITDLGCLEDYLTDLLLVTQNDANLITTIWELLCPIGYGFILLYFLMAILQETQSRFKDMDEKFFIILFLKLVVADAVMYCGPQILSFLLNLGNYFIQYFVENPLSVTDTVDTDAAADQAAQIMQLNSSFVATIEKAGFMGVLGCFFYSAILQFASFIPQVMITLHAISRKIEIIIRGGLSCWAIPDVFDEGRKSHAINYLKKYAVVILHGFVMLFVVQIASILTAEIAFDKIMQDGSITMGLDTFTSLINVALYNFAAVGLISASKSILNDVFS